MGLNETLFLVLMSALASCWRNRAAWLRRAFRRSQLVALDCGDIQAATIAIVHREAGRVVPLSNTPAGLPSALLLLVLVVILHVFALVG
jgi:hypothetical protein